MTPEQQQRLFDAGWILAMVLLCVFVLALLSQQASASLLVKQGDIIYMNETLDLSQAASWPDFTLAWCKGYSNCDHPDAIVDISEGNMDNYYIDPAVFKYGTWYRWDGEWHRGENAVAFVINPGTRPAVVKPTLASNNTTSVAIKNPEGPFFYLIANGDAPLLSVRLDRVDSCNIWIFGNNNKAYGVPMIYRNQTYFYQFTAADTAGMGVGSFSGYIQCNGNNGWQDISYAGGSLTTPYRSVSDIPLAGLTPQMVKQRFDSYTTTVPKFDDKLYPIEVAVTVMATTITDVTQDEKILYLKGTTSWSDGTVITLKIDPENYVLDRDIKAHTWKVIASGPVDAYRTFAIGIPLDKTQLAVGSHQIIASVDKNGYASDSYYDFMISDIYVMPTPTPEIKRMIYGKEYEQIPVKIIPTPTPEPTVTVTPNQTVTVTPAPTVTVSGNATTVQTTVPVPVKTTPNVTVPLPIWIGVMGVIITIVMRRL